jgi:hypothetical protein
VHCAVHPGEHATRECTRCQAWHCSACVRTVAVHGSSLEACAHCDGLLKSAPELVQPAQEELPELLRRCLTADSLLMALALAVPAWIARLPFLGIIAALLNLVYWSAVLGYYFRVIDHIGRGRPGLPGPADTATDDYGAMVATVLRGFLCALVAGVPAFLWLALGGHEPGDLVSRPLVLLGLLLCGLCYLPAAILAVVLTDRTVAAAWPPAWVAIATRAPTSYARLVALFFASTVVWWLANLVAAFFLGRIPLFGGLLCTATSNLVLFAQATLVGGFVRRNAEVLGH